MAPDRHARQEVFEVAAQEGEQVAGLIAAWGEVEVHETGFRAQYAKPTAFLLPTRSHNPVYARWVRALAASYRAEVVTVGSSDDLARYCADRALGLTEPAVAELLAPAHARDCQRRTAVARRTRRSFAWLVAMAGAAVDVSRSDARGAARRLRAMQSTPRQ